MNKLLHPNADAQITSADAFKTHKVLKSIASAEKLNVCDANLPTEHELRCLLEATSDASCRASALLRVSLFLGRSLETLLDESDRFVQFPAVDYISEFGFFELQRDYPSSHLDDASIFEPETEKRALICVPKECSSSLIKVYSDIQLSGTCVDDYKQQVRIKLSEINAKFKTRLTASRIARYFYAYCLEQGISEIRYAAIAGKGLEFHAGSYYTQFENQQIVDVQTRFAAHLARLAGKSLFTLAKPKQKSYWGSLRVPTEEQVAQCFNEMLENSVESRRNTDFLALHNWYLAYTLGILQIATGYRPEHTAFGNLDMFDLINGYVFISDKKVGKKHQRIVKLCSTAIAQLESFIAHLKTFRANVRGVYPYIVSGVDDILSGKKPLLCFIHKESFNFTVPLKLPEEIGEAREYLVANYFRHILRSRLDLAQVPTDLIDWFMGHEAKVDHSFSRFSSIENKHAMFIAEHIQRILDDLQLKSAPSPLKR